MNRQQDAFIERRSRVKLWNCQFEHWNFEDPFACVLLRILNVNEKSKQRVHLFYIIKVKVICIF